jgi:hypothetical protein
MKEIDVASWEEFEEQLRLLRQQRARRKTETVLHVSDLLFRGQHDHTRKLLTTLERQRKGQLTPLPILQADLRSAASN